MRIKQSICYPLFKTDDVSWDDFCTKVAAMGYAAIEFWARGPWYDEAVAAAHGHDLAVAQMSGHHSLPVGLNDPGEHDRIEAELKESVDLAAAAGIPGLIVFSGNRREGLTDEAGLEATVAGLKRAAPHAEAKGINLNLELLNSKVDHPGYQCDHSAWGFEVCRRVDSPNVKVLFDIYHMQIMEGDVIRTIRDNIKWIGHFHTAGVPGRNDFDDTQELNYVGICRAIAESGYDLYVGHEFKPKGEPYAALAQAFAICDQG